jgi:putative molybdopterin biosynthesis protein
MVTGHSSLGMTMVVMSVRDAGARRAITPGCRLRGGLSASHRDVGALPIGRRPFGTGARALLDRLLADAGIAPASVTGPQAASHLEVAMSVASGQADTGLGVRAAATALGLGFVPVIWEDFDIVLSGDALPAAEPLIAALRTPAVQSPVGALGGYDLSRAGSVDLLA